MSAAPSAPSAGDWKPDYSPAIVENALRPDHCDRAIEIAHRIGFETSLVLGYDRLGQSEPKHRNSQSVYLANEHYPELYGVIMASIQTINNGYYRFAITGVERLQVIRYLPGCFFNEHLDIGSEVTARRKLSLVIQLSDSADYEGGDLILGNYLTAPRVRGGGCIFPSWVPHRVTEIKGGMRYSLVTWATGDYFR